MAVTISGSSGVSTNALPFIIGQVCMFAMATPPTGFLKCAGQAISRSTYSALFGLIGTIYGAGDGSTTFNLPDIRGEFIRGFDDGRGVDSGRVLGSIQADELKSHTHGVKGVSVSVGSGVQNQVVLSSGAGVADNTVASGGSESRPRNVALLACIFTGV